MLTSCAHSPIKLAMILPLILCSTLTSCTASYTYQLIDQTLVDTKLKANPQVQRSNHWVMPQSSTIWVAFPQNKQPQKFNRLVKDSLTLSLAQQFAMVDSARDPEGFNASIKRARHRGFSYMLYPKLIRQDDYVNSVMEMDEDMERFDQMGQDVLVLTLLLVDVATERLIDSTVVRTEGGYMHIYRQSPSDLIELASTQYANMVSQ
jgi:Domain of unknown function (DUF4823)